jgi:hypothetical protein
MGGRGGGGSSVEALRGVVIVPAHNSSVTVGRSRLVIAYRIKTVLTNSCALIKKIPFFGPVLLYFTGQVLGHAYGMVPADTHAYILDRRFAPHLRFQHGHQLAPCS